MATIGILTFQFAHNYGAQLQAYALKTALEAGGPDVRVIHYLPRGLAEHYATNPFVLLKSGSLRRILRLPVRMKQARKFRRFGREHLALSEPMHTIRSETLARFDAVVVGSDQVWSDKIVPDVRAYFLADVQGVRKFSYAASFGSHSVSPETERCVQAYLPDFDRITVREASAADIVTRLTGQDAVQTADPVFLLEPAAWRQLYQSHPMRRETEPYILYVDLRNDPALIAKAKELQQQTGHKVYAIHPTGWRVRERSFSQRYDVGPLEFLHLIDQAAYVVTNSFHAVAFSCIFAKQVVYYAKGELGDRVNDLFRLLGVDKAQPVVDLGEPAVQEKKGAYAAASRQVVAHLLEAIGEDADGNKIAYQQK